MTMITPSYLGETIEYSSLHACRSTLEDPTLNMIRTGTQMTPEGAVGVAGGKPPPSLKPLRRSGADVIPVDHDPFAVEGAAGVTGGKLYHVAADWNGGGPTATCPQISCWQ